MTDDKELRGLFKDEERILVAAWMLPNEGALSGAMENFSRYICKHGLTPSDVGRKLGTPKGTTIHELLNGNYRQNADAQIRRLNLFVEQHARQQAASLGDAFVTTNVAKEILGVARLVRENQTMGLIVAPTGVGKSRCAEAVAEKYVGAIYLRVITGQHSPRGITNALAECVGVRKLSNLNRPARHHTQIERLIEALRNSGRLIVLDEAHQLNDGAINLLRDIHDSCGVPILLLATKDLHDRIRRDADADHGQLYSRSDVVVDLGEGHDVTQGGKPLFSMADIKELYNQTPIKLHKDATEYLFDVANMLGYGSLRRCKIVLRNAVRRARKRKGLDDGDAVSVSADDLAAVERIMRRTASEKNVMEDRQGRRARTAGA